MAYRINPFTGELDKVLGPGRGTASIEFASDSGDANPTGAGVITIAGGTGLNTAGAGSTITVNLDVPVVETNGGTGQTTYTTGDILYASGANTLSKLAVGADTEVLTLAAGVPTWAPNTSGQVDSVSGTTNRITISGTATDPIVDIAATYVGQSTITTLGTVTTGTWNASTVSEPYGGTNQTTYATGDILYASGANTLSKLAAGSNGEVLKLAAGIPSWETDATGGQVDSVSGTADRITISGTAVDPVVDIAATYVGQASITTLGTISTGTWEGTAVDETHGGTNQTTYTTGDILYASGANTLSKLAVGSNTEVLTLAAGVPTWAAPTVGTVTSVSGTTNRISSTGGATPVIDIDAAYVGQTSITTLGTIGTGTWEATDVGVAHGGTGRSSHTAYAVLCGGTTTTAAQQSIASVGTSGQVLTSNGAAALPTFQAAATGDVTAASNLTDNLVVRGDGGTKGVQTSTVSISDAGEMTNASQPAFLAYLATSDTNATGAGSVYLYGDTDTNTALTEVYDQNSDFTGGSSSGASFTAPVSGKYLLTLQSTMSSASSATELTPRIITSNRTYARKTTISATTGSISMSINVIADLDASDTVTWDFVGAGMAGNTGTMLGTSELRNCVSGALIC